MIVVKYVDFEAAHGVARLEFLENKVWFKINIPHCRGSDNVDAMPIP